MRPCFDPDGIALPRFIVTIPRGSPDLSHLDVLTAWHGLLAPAAAVGGGCLRFRGAGPDFSVEVKVRSDIYFMLH